ncbi:Transmembrane protein 94, partial [Araneus ventricosus]
MIQVHMLLHVAYGGATFSYLIIFADLGNGLDSSFWDCWMVQGLGILLNTCNPKAQEHYTKFSDHIACESLYNESAVPVVNKRCLCELAKQIGFADSVVDFYELEQQIGIFRHVHPEIVQKGKLARSLNFPRLKMPFPNMTCAILKDLHRGSNQLFSQGTADLILDACNEYWDGADIRVLTESD